MTDTKVKIRPSSSGFKRGEMVFTTYNSGCLRYIKAARKAQYTPIDPIYAEVGLQHEENHEEFLADRLTEREFVIKFDLTGDVEYSGRCDFIDSDGAVHETKATLSKSSRDSIVRQGKYNVNHLAQIVSYMIFLELEQGYLVVGYYEKDETKNIFVKQEQRTFNITIGSTGLIFVDGEESEYSIMDYMEHVEAQIDLFKTVLPPRPYIKSRFSSPCSLCPMAETCDSVDIGEISLSEWMPKSVEAINSQVQRPAKYNVVKPKRGTKK